MTGGQRLHVVFAEDVLRTSSPTPAATGRCLLPNALKQRQKSMQRHFIGSVRTAR